MTLTKREELLLDYISAVIDEEGQGILQDRESCQIILCGYFCTDLFETMRKHKEGA